MNTVLADPSPPGIDSIRELADEFGWTARTVPTAGGKTRLELHHGSHTVMAWWYPNGALDIATLYRDNHPAEFGEVARTQDRGVVVGWVAAHGTRTSGEVAA